MNRKSSVMAGIGAALLAASLALGGCASGGGQQTAALQQRIANARTGADHEDLAGHFEREAQVLREKANEHVQMTRAYGFGGYGLAETGFVQHCEALARRYRSAAEENLALARLHRQAAAKAGQ
jgi:hypothetical protein